MSEASPPTSFYGHSLYLEALNDINGLRDFATGKSIFNVYLGKEIKIYAVFRCLCSDLVATRETVGLKGGNPSCPCFLCNQNMKDFADSIQSPKPTCSYPNIPQLLDLLPQAENQQPTYTQQMLTSWFGIRYSSVIHKFPFFQYPR